MLENVYQSGQRFRTAEKDKSEKSINKKERWRADFEIGYFLVLI